MSHSSLLSSEPQHSQPDRPVSQPEQQLQTLFDAQYQASRQQPEPDLSARKQALTSLMKLLQENQQAICDAISQDYGYRAPAESRLAEIGYSIDMLRDTRRQLKKWMRPQRRHVDRAIHGINSNRLIPQSLGVIGIIVPWNYPITLSFGPLATAIAAGNRAMVKMSENSVHLSRLLQKLLAEHFPPEQICLLADDKPESPLGPQFSRLPFDHLLFTGSAATGRKVMQSAAANLTPVTLELGGKSPVILSEEFDLKAAVRRIIVLGKSLNAGQTCIAPDYLFLPRHLKQPFIDEARRQLREAYPQWDQRDFTAIIDQPSHQRLLDTLSEAEAAGAEVINLLPDYPREQASRKLAPHLLFDTRETMQIEQRETFGPLLMVKLYDDVSEALDYINARPRPLALYLFSLDKALQQRVLRETRSGAMVINQVITHVAQHDLPFGGVGDSGMGHYHGYDGFMTMSSMRPLHVQRGSFSGFDLIRAPHGKVHQWLYKFMAR